MTAPKQVNQGVNRLKTRVSILWSGVFLCLLLWVIGSSYSWQNYENVLKNTEITLQETGQRLAQYTALSFKQKQLALQRAAETVLLKPDEFKDNAAKTQQFLTDLFSSYEQISHVQIFNEDATVIVAHLHLEEQFSAPLTNGLKKRIKNSEILIPFFSRFENSPDILFVNPILNIDAPEKIFISATIKSSYIEEIFNAGMQNHDVALLLSTKAENIYAYPHEFDISIYQQNQIGNQTLNHRMINHKRSLIVTTKVPNYDLFITLSKNHEAIFQDWRDETLAFAIIALIFSGFIIFAAYSLNNSVSDLHSEVLTRRAAEDSLRVVSQAVEQSPTSVIITDKYSNITYANAKFTETSGYELEEVIGKNPSILSSGKQDRKDYENMWQLVLAGKSWRGVFHNRKKDGSLYWERTLVTSIKNENDEISHFLAIKEDITQNKMAEDQLKMAAAVFEAASEAIMVCDQFNRIMMVNNSFSEITGFDESEVLGQTPAILNSGRHDTKFFASMFKHLEHAGQWQGEIWNRRKNGEIYPQWLSIKTVLDEKNKIERYISLFTDITQRKQDEERILYQANYDALTGLPNRSLFKDRLERAVYSAERTNKKIALMFLDLDRFKNVNDTLGHAAGDALLVEASRRLMDTVRRTDTVARLGGDEFTIILEDLQNEHQTKSLIEKLLKRLSAPYDIGKDQAFVSASIGITIFPNDANSVEELLKNADAAMYRAKENGRNMSQFFTAEMNENAHKRRALETSLYQALEREEFDVHYQPIVDPSNGKLVSCEALLRWIHPEHGYVSPATFIPLAEETGQIVPIGQWVINTVFHEAKLWEKHQENPPKVSVNLSSIQFKRANAANIIEQALLDENLSPNRVTVEITESLLVEDDDLIMDQLKQIREMGVGLSIDDFGTGYSSLSYLKKFPITTLKIDRSFISDMTTSTDSENIVDAILSMAESLKLEVVAEGVETAEQRSELLEKECPLIQGFYYSPPIPVVAFRTMIKKNSPLTPDDE